MLGVFPKDAKGLKASVLLMVAGRVGYVCLDLLKRRVKACLLYTSPSPRD